MSQHVFDVEMMAMAIKLARHGLESTSPNPRVGCVIARDRQVLAIGWHRQAGGPHAEIEALNAIGGSANGATAYVTLEPCAHHGRTGPCVEALIAAGVARVVIAGRDPNPLVAGKSVERLQAAGINVQDGVLRDAAAALNPGFLRRMRGGLPWVRLKMAASLDGRTAMASGESKWITSLAARRDVQRLRARSCAVVTGIATVLADDPRMDVREGSCDGVPRQPLRVVLDSMLRTPRNARILELPGSVLLVHGQKAAQAAFGEHVETLGLPGDRPDLETLLRSLAERQCNEVMVEAGPTLAGAFLAAGLVDELVIYQAPTLLGSRGRPMFELPFDDMSQQLRLDVIESVRVGVDTRITARPRFAINRADRKDRE